MLWSLPAGETGTFPPFAGVCFVCILAATPKRENNTVCCVIYTLSVVCVPLLALHRKLLVAAALLDLNRHGKGDKSGETGLQQTAPSLTPVSLLQPFCLSHAAHVCVPQHLDRVNGELIEPFSFNYLLFFLPLRTQIKDRR